MQAESAIDRDEQNEQDRNTKIEQDRKTFTYCFLIQSKYSWELEVCPIIFLEDLVLIVSNIALTTF